MSLVQYCTTELRKVQDCSFVTIIWVKKVWDVKISAVKISHTFFTRIIVTKLQSCTVPSSVLQYCTKLTSMISLVSIQHKRSKKCKVMPWIHEFRTILLFSSWFLFHSFLTLKKAEECCWEVNAHTPWCGVWYDVVCIVWCGLVWILGAVS